MGQILAIKTQEATKQKDLALKAAGNRDGPPLYWLRIIAILHLEHARKEGG